MSPIIKLEDRPAVSLVLVKPSSHPSVELTSLNPVDGISRAQLMQLIYTLMLLVGQNMSLIQNSFAQNQLDMANISKKEAANTQDETDKYLSKLSELQAQQQQAQKWSEASTILKWIGVGVGILLGALLCETPVGFIMLAAVVAFTASPLFDKAVNTIGGAIGKAIGNSTWGKVIAQVIILVVLTVATCGAEGLSTGISKLATTAGEDGVEGGTQSLLKAAEEEGTKAAEQAAEDASSQAAKSTENTTSTTKIGSFKPKWSFASASVFTQTLLSSNLTGELVNELIEAIPGNKNSKKWAEMILTVILDIAISLASFKAASNGANLMKSLSDITKSPALIRLAMGTVVGASQAGTAAAQGGSSYNQYEQGQTQTQLAPLQSNVVLTQGLYQILNQIASLSQQIYKSLMESNTILFRTDFAADWKACVEAQQV